jgi:hypothetical protein
MNRNQAFIGILKYKIRYLYYLFFWMILIACPPTVPEKKLNIPAPQANTQQIVANYFSTYTYSIQLPFRFYTDSASYPHQHLSRLSSEALVSLQKNFRILQIDSVPFIIDVIYVDDREKLKPITGFTPKGLAYPMDYLLLIATNDSIRAYHTHELMHILSTYRMGGLAASPGDWIQEGLSVYADDPCLEYAMEQIAANLVYTDMWIPLDSLVHHFRSLPDLTAYLQAGAVVQFIIESYGLKWFEILWKQGIPAFEKTVGKSWKQIERDCIDKLKKKYPSLPTVDWKELHRRGCG